MLISSSDIYACITRSPDWTWIVSPGLCSILPAIHFILYYLTWHSGYKFNYSHCSNYDKFDQCYRHVPLCKEEVISICHHWTTHGRVIDLHPSLWQNLKTTLMNAKDQCYVNQKSNPWWWTKGPSGWEGHFNKYLVGGLVHDEKLDPIRSNVL